jgi:hypothetical protein
MIVVVGRDRQKVRQKKIGNKKGKRVVRKLVAVACLLLSMMIWSPWLGEWHSFIVEMPEGSVSPCKSPE